MTWIAAITLLTTGCLGANEEPMGLVGSFPTGGPMVEFDLDERPFPNVPFPNDVATRIDPTSPTGRRVNVSYLGASKAEERVRTYINKMSGFGVYSPMSVSFDAPLDVENLIRRHQERVPDFSDDAVYLVNVDRRSPNFGKLELLDMGRGNFPITLARTDYFINDARRHGSNLLFETEREIDHSGTGVLDPIDDTDDDGTWDEPNTRTPDGDLYKPGEMLDFYERETNTLILRPVHPLEPGTTYAVVLTRALRGADGRAIDSPFKYINHTAQTEALEPLREILPGKFPERFDKALKGVRFAWSFTTHVPTEDLEAIRAGLYGHGPLSWLSTQFPARLNMVHAIKGANAEDPLTFDLTRLMALIIPVATDEIGSEGARVVEESFADIDYVISGTFLSPNFLADKDGLADEGVDAALLGANMQDDDEAFWIDLATGEAHVGVAEVPFMCAIPKELNGKTAPFPTIIYSHAISSTRLEMLVFAGAMAKFGFATCTIDAVGHGLDIPREFHSLIDSVARNQGLPNLNAVLTHHRARDLTNDGAADSGGDYFSADILHSRDMMRQTTIDQMQLIRILRTFDGTLRWPDTIDEENVFIQARRDLVAGWDQTGDGNPELAGDFNGDGTVDLGGEQDYVAWGTSLGGLQTGILAGIEPTVRAAASNAGGGGLGDIAVRTTISNVRVGVVLRMMGPLLIGRPYVNSAGERTGGTRLDWILPQTSSEVLVHFADLEGIEEGDRVVLRNPKREDNHLIADDEKDSTTYVRNGGFRVGIGADAITATARRAHLGFDPVVNLRTQIMGCHVARRCNDVECPNNHYCSLEDNTCQPVGLCVTNFEPRLVQDEDLLKELALRTVADATEFGDHLIIEIYGADGTLKQSIDTFPQNLVFQNILYPPGSPLAALTEGWGLKRQTPRFRSFMGIAQTMLEPADPAVYASHYFLNPLKYPYETPAFREGWTNFLTVGTLGDQTVPISTSIALARASGVLDTLEIDPRYGTTENDYLIENFVYEGISSLNRFPDYPNTLFDPDNLDRGQFAQPKPEAEHPLRAMVQTPHGVSGLRLPYLRTTGEHTFNAPNPAAPFDIHTFMTNQVGWYLATGGTDLSDDVCLQEMFMTECSFFGN